MSFFDNQNQAKILKAYQQYQASCEKVDLGLEKNYEKISSILISDLQNKIAKGNIEINDEFINTFFIGEAANAVASEKQATGTRQNFIIFLKDKTTQSILYQLFELRRNTPPDTKNLISLDEIKLHMHLEKFKFPGSNNKKPFFYINRMLVMIFPDFAHIFLAPSLSKKPCMNWT